MLDVSVTEPEDVPVAHAAAKRRMREARMMR